MRKVVFFIVFVLITCSMTVLADKERVNDRYTVTSPNGKFLIELIPANNFGEAGKGFAFAKEDSHRLDTLWKIDWFAKKVFLADDGAHLIRFGPWASDKNRLTDKAIGFYKKGKVLKQYLVKDLVKDAKSISASVSHYTWESCDSAIVSGLSKDFKSYTLVTTDRIVYIFNTSTGKITKKKILSAGDGRIMGRKKTAVAKELQ